MILRSKLLPLILVSGLSIAGCSGGGQKTLGPEGPPAGPGPQQTTQTPGTPTVQEGITAERTTVDDCNASVQGTVADAKTALTLGDFNKANCIASLAFNTSVTANPDKPDTQAAWVAFFAKFALLVETPEMNYLVGNTPPLKAADYFGPAGTLENLGKIFETRWPNATLPGFRGELAVFLKMHSDLGHSVNDVFSKMNEFITAHFPDLHILLSAMAKDVKFELKDTDIIGSKIFQNEWNSGDKATFTEAGIFDFWVSAFRAFANLAPRYDLGFGVASLNGADLTGLVNDMNTDSRILTLLGNANANDAIPIAKALFASTIQVVKNIVAKKPQAWTGDLFPKKPDDQLRFLVLAMDLQKSLDENKMIPLAVSGYDAAVNVAKLLNQLPTSQGIAGNVVKLSSGDIEPEDNFLKQFTSGFLQEL